MTQTNPILMSHCRRCGGERCHSVIAEETRDWDQEDAGINGSDTWSIVECRGCQTITFVHSHSLSEDYTYNANGDTVAVVRRDLYPPAPSRIKPEWGSDNFFAFALDEHWIPRLHMDIYAALGLGAHALAAMGMRTIVDYVVTSKAGDSGGFKDKLNRLANNLITQTQVGVIFAAFDAGSAAAHRGYIPTEQDTHTLLDITETLLEQMYIAPARARRQEAAAHDLASRTPPRKKIN